MILKVPGILAIAATLSMLPASLLAEAANRNAAPSAETVGASTTAGQNEAMHMVPATVMLLETLDARKMQPGADFKAKLNNKVHLANGSELPSGSVLVGTVVQDDMHIQGNVKLAVRFTQAQLKDGQTIPIKATIVGAYTDPQEAATAYNGYTAEPSNNWNDGTIGTDQIGVTSGVDLHSNIHSLDSGVFATSRKDDIKLDRGSDINLAIAPAAPGTGQSATVGAGS
jgi:hypothetical protein